MTRILLVALVLLLAACGTQPAAPTPLADGVYEVLAVEPDAHRLEPITPGTRIVPFDHAYLRGGAERPVEYVLLRERGAAPLDLAKAPQQSTMGDRPVLLITLTTSAGEALEALTAKAERAAVVVDGAIVTMHRIRVPIEGGRLQVSC